MIYEKDVAFFLECFSTSLNEISDIWKEKQRLLSPQDLAVEIIRRKNYSPDATEVLISLIEPAFPKDIRSGASERQNFFYGLADYYAETINPKCALVEFDIGNCGGTGDYVGDDNLHKIIRFMRVAFEKTLKAHGAELAESFDNAKNDDLKIVVSGLTSAQITEAIIEAQELVKKRFLFASDIPHSKYPGTERNGIGVGSGFARLGRGQSPQELQERLNLFVEKRKLEDALARNAENLGTGDTKVLDRGQISGLLTFIFNNNKDVQSVPKVRFPFVAGETAIPDLDPVKSRMAACDEVAAAKNLTASERDVMHNILKFYHKREALTGARRDNTLYEDMQWVRESLPPEDKLAVLNIKVENCAGINKVLSHIHSAEMTKHFLDILVDFTNRNFPDFANPVYYVGRNSFNVLLPQVVADDAKVLFETYFQDEVNRHINEQQIGPYFARFGLQAPESLGAQKVGSIPNLRGLGPGVLAINIEAVDESDLKSEEELIDFQSRSVAGHRYKNRTYEVRLPNDISFDEMEKGKTSAELYRALRSMADDIISYEQGDGVSANRKPPATKGVQPK